PDGKEVAFVSERDGSSQVYVVPVEGALPTGLTRHTAGYALEAGAPDAKKLLARAARDHYCPHAERFFWIPRDGRPGDELVFDDYGQQAAVSPDGRKLLFTREGEPWWRKGYHGSQASQVWLYDLDAKIFTKVANSERGSTWPLWKPDGSGCYFASSSNGGHLHLCEHSFGTGENRQLTSFADDSVVQPCISADGRTIVFRHLFDLYRFQPGSSAPPVKLTITTSTDRGLDPFERR